MAGKNIKDRGMKIERADREDLENILTLQKLAYLSEADIYQDHAIEPLTQTLSMVRDEFDRQQFFKVNVDENIIASVRAYFDQGTCFIGKLIVHPDFQNKGLGTRLMRHVEQVFSKANRYELFTGHNSERNLHLYQKLGYRPFREKKVSPQLTLVFLEKRI